MTRDENVRVLKMIALSVAHAYVLALVCFGNDQIITYSLKPPQVRKTDKK